jgi:hypothetical protein
MQTIRPSGMISPQHTHLFSKVIIPFPVFVNEHFNASPYSCEFAEVLLPSSY